MSTVITEAGGYDHHFVATAPDRLVCKICQCPSRDPYLSVCCGHNFCKSCLDGAKKAVSVAHVCPLCRNEMFQTVPNRQADREIRSLHVMCTNKERGCEWQGELNDINNHLGNSDGCQFENVKCSNECGKMLQRQYMTSHVETECPHRKVDCQYCHITGEHQFIEGEHKEQCPKLPLPCPNKCEVGSVPREDMETHKKECPLEMVQCAYRNVGCKEKMLREDIERHEQDCMKEHLKLTTKFVGMQQDHINTLTATIVVTEKNLSTAKHELVSTKQELGELKRLTSNLTQNFTDLEAKFQAAIEALKSHTTNTCATKTQIQGIKDLLGITAGQINYLPWMRSLQHSCIMGEEICPVIIKLPKFADRMKDEARWYSHPFYSHNKRYRMCLRVIVAGSGSSLGTHLSLYLSLMRGTFDSSLTWPLKGVFAINLLNQVMDGEHFYNIVTFDQFTPSHIAGRVLGKDDMAADGLGYKQFISHVELTKVTETCQYVRDDCIFIKVSKLS
ncbi:TNF receptor-associated factor 4-like [Dysidea avara]|uniref:TNF receptor-associated factor 4-like n=1 Tax=Dysidea avara TaxID=196820 RepID=UPI00332A68C1